MVLSRFKLLFFSQEQVALKRELARHCGAPLFDCRRGEGGLMTDRGRLPWQTLARFSFELSLSPLPDIFCQPVARR